MAKTKNKKENFKGVGMDELKKHLDAFGESLREMRFKSMGSKSKNVKEAGALKKQIARIWTEMNKDNNENKKNK